MIPAHHCGEGTDQETGLIFREDQARNPFDRFSLILIHTDEIGVWINLCRRDRRVMQGIANSHDHIVVDVTEGCDVFCVIF
jgi:hypothetical protein